MPAFAGRLVRRRRAGKVQELNQADMETELGRRLSRTCRDVTQNLPSFERLASRPSSCAASAAARVRQFSFSIGRGSVPELAAPVRP